MNLRVVAKVSRRSFARWAVLASVACALTSAAAAPNPVSGPKASDGYQTAAPHAILIEAESGTVLFEKGADDLIPPASMSKLMTQEVVFNEIRQGRLAPTTEFRVSTNAWRRGGAPSRTSTMFMPINSKVAVDDLLHGAIIQSANDACIVLAEGISGNESTFAELMTKRARELGLTKSTFGNSTGLPDPRQLMTARELAKLARHIVETYPNYYKYYSEREFTSIPC
jgi:serine-type D-Ala-D-Ala carboxypeptidase (penicillin-binding protein 5/6)